MRISCNARDSGSEYRLLHLQIKAERLKYIKDIKLFNLVVKFFVDFLTTLKTCVSKVNDKGEDNDNDKYHVAYTWVVVKLR